ncbi:MAG: Dabb family protein [Porticoccaceae bacterium]
MPLQHIVWLKKKDYCSQQQMQVLLDEVCSLANVISEIQSVNSGINITDRADGFSHGIIVTVADQRALQAYISHPAHIAVGKKLVKNADILAMDFEC